MAVYVQTVLPSTFTLSHGPSQLERSLRYRHIHQLCRAPTQPPWCQVPSRPEDPYSRTRIESPCLQRRPYWCARPADRQVVG